MAERWTVPPGTVLNRAGDHAVSMASRLDLEVEVKHTDIGIDRASIWIGGTHISIREEFTRDEPPRPTGRVLVEIDSGQEPLSIYYDDMELSD